MDQPLRIFRWYLFYWITRLTFVVLFSDRSSLLADSSFCVSLSWNRGNRRCLRWLNWRGGLKERSLTHRCIGLFSWSFGSLFEESTEQISFLLMETRTTKMSWYQCWKDTFTVFGFELSPTCLLSDKFSLLAERSLSGDSSCKTWKDKFRVKTTKQNTLCT